MSEITIDQVITMARRLAPEQQRLLLSRLAREISPPSLAEQLANARSQIIASGIALLDRAGIEAEIAERRGSGEAHLR
jgi:hypothetical protein